MDQHNGRGLYDNLKCMLNRKYIKSMFILNFELSSVAPFQIVISEASWNLSLWDSACAVLCSGAGALIPMHIFITYNIIYVMYL